MSSLQRSSSGGGQVRTNWPSERDPLPWTGHRLEAVAEYSTSFCSLTAKKTAKPADDCGRRRMITDCRLTRSNLGGLQWTPADVSPAVFKTVCGALLRRPGWVRFPSIPATFAVVTATGPLPALDNYPPIKSESASTGGRAFRWRAATSFDLRFCYRDRK